jgi:hypothetical protein
MQDKTKISPDQTYTVRLPGALLLELVERYKRSPHDTWADLIRKAMQIRRTAEAAQKHPGVAAEDLLSPDIMARFT